MKASTWFSKLPPKLVTAVVRVALPLRSKNDLRCYHKGGLRIGRTCGNRYNTVSCGALPFPQYVRLYQRKIASLAKSIRR